MICVPREGMETRFAICSDDSASTPEEKRCCAFSQIVSKFSFLIPKAAGSWLFMIIAPDAQISKRKRQKSWWWRGTYRFQP